jgi:Cdc6-like AAA superfamily ATPase
MPNPNIHNTSILPKDLVKEPEVLKFFMEDINELLDNYEPGKPQNKPDVTKQLSEISKDREQMMQKVIKEQQEYRDTITKLKMLGLIGNN